MDELPNLDDFEEYESFEILNEEIDDAPRARLRKVEKLKRNGVIEYGEFLECRKLFMSVYSGVVRVQVQAGLLEVNSEFKAGFKGGILSDGGGAFDPRKLSIRIIGVEDAKFYIHIEWLDKKITIGIRG